MNGVSACWLAGLVALNPAALFELVRGGKKSGIKARVALNTILLLFLLLRYLLLLLHS